MYACFVFGEICFGVRRMCVLRSWLPWKIPVATSTVLSCLFKTRIGYLKKKKKLKLNIMRIAGLVFQTDWILDKLKHLFKTILCLTLLDMGNSSTIELSAGGGGQLLETHTMCITPSKVAASRISVKNIGEEYFVFDCFLETFLFVPNVFMNVKLD